MLYKFTNEYPDSKIDEIIDYVRGPRLWIAKNDYPDYDDWLERSWIELKRQEKRALVAKHYDNIVGVLIYQRHRKADTTLELKNLTVRPNHQGRYLASFLLRNAEIEGSIEYKTKEIVCDTKVGNLSIQIFLKKHKYITEKTLDLYGLGSGKDVVYIKKINQKLLNIYKNENTCN